MDAIILAAGRGGRLNGLAAPYHKPLLPIDGVPLITRAVDVAARNCEAVIVVASPENAWPISQVLGDREVLMVIQREPRGPGHALLRGLTVTTYADVLVLLADNVISDEDVEHVVEFRGIGVRDIPAADAERFSRWNFVQHRWVERVPVDKEQTTDLGQVRVWVGPLVVNKIKTRAELSAHLSDEELLIGPHLSHILATGAHVLVDSHDIGTVNTYTERTTPWRP